MKIKNKCLYAAICMLLMLMCANAFAAGVALEYETIVPGNTATGITASKISKTAGAWAHQNATAALITVEDNSIMFTVDGTPPTASAGTNVGHRMDAWQSYYIRGYQNIKNFLCIDRVAGSASKVKVTIFYGGE